MTVRGATTGLFYNFSIVPL